LDIINDTAGGGVIYVLKALVIVAMLHTPHIGNFILGLKKMLYFLR